ncbi:hypothetical protein PGT21_032094 [Puccinia graminis f. sp. tritici]|uniref:Uncharacterized protein n=1 Tax=Puccinia graminis f. sp. tritici TaxID=56615 RepID=A0A5B0M067_PUCGR|nr:hypothetical protein PGT21_032094 [Puccinia graminis f. sp. tritici]
MSCRPQCEVLNAIKQRALHLPMSSIIPIIRSSPQVHTRHPLPADLPEMHLLTTVIFLATVCNFATAFLCVGTAVCHVEARDKLPERYVVSQPQDGGFYCNVGLGKGKCCPPGVVPGSPKPGEELDVGYAKWGKCHDA